MRMPYIMGSALLLTLGLRIVDPPAAPAAPPAVSAKAVKLIVAVPRGGSHRADDAAERKAGR